MAPVINQLLTTFKFLVILIRRHLLVIATYSQLRRHLLVIATYSQLLIILNRKDLQVIAETHQNLMFAKFKELLKSFKYLLKAKKFLTLKIDCDVSFLKDWFMH